MFEDFRCCIVLVMVNLNTNYEVPDTMGGSQKLKGW